MLNKNHIRESMSDKVFLIIVNIILFLILVSVLFPLIFVINASISDPVAVSSGKVWLWPVDLNFAGYEAALQNNNILFGFRNSIIYTLLGTVYSVGLTLLMAFPLSRRDFSGRKFILTLLTITMFFSGGLIPTYLLVYRLKMVNTIWAMIILGGLSAWNVFLARNFMNNNIPDEMFEAASIDGCNELQFFGRFALPLSTPIIAVLVLYTGVAYWNAYFNAIVYLYDPKLMPLQVVLRDILVLSTSMDLSMYDDPEIAEKMSKQGDLLKYAVIVIASTPVMLLYPFVQKYFVKGIMVGAIKG